MVLSVRFVFIVCIFAFACVYAFTYFMLTSTERSGVMRSCSDNMKLESTHRVRSHADDWLRHLANVDECTTQNGLLTSLCDLDL